MRQNSLFCTYKFLCALAVLAVSPANAQVTQTYPYGLPGANLVQGSGPGMARNPNGYSQAVPGAIVQQGSVVYQTNGYPAVQNGATIVTPFGAPGGVVYTRPGVPGGIYANPYGNPYANPYVNPYVNPYGAYPVNPYSGVVYGAPVPIGGGLFNLRLGNTQFSYWRAPSGYYYPWYQGYSAPVVIVQENQAAPAQPAVSTIMADMDNFLSTAKTKGRLSDTDFTHLNTRLKDLERMSDSMRQGNGGSLSADQEQDMRNNLQLLGQEISHRLK